MTKYIMQVRVNKAKELMIMTRGKVNIVSRSVGYEDSRYFSRIFKKVTGETPSEFWKKQAEDDEKDKE